MLIDENGFVVFKVTQSTVNKLESFYSCKETNPDDKSDSIIISQRSGDSIKFQFRSFYWSNPSQLSLSIECSTDICNSLTSSCQMVTFHLFEYLLFSLIFSEYLQQKEVNN